MIVQVWPRWESEPLTLECYSYALEGDILFLYDAQAGREADEPSAVIRQYAYFRVAPELTATTPERTTP